MKTRSFLDRLYSFISQRPVYHALFWICLFSTMVMNGHSNNAASGKGWLFTFSSELVGLIFYSTLVYFNLYYLIPSYLAKRTVLYIGLVLAACAVLTPLEILTLYLKYTGLPQFQEDLVKNQDRIFMGNVFVVVISTILRVIMDWWRYQTEKQMLMTRTMQSELRFLKSQINPHFLFNTLNNLYEITLKKSDQAPEIVLKLSEIMRYMLYECNERRVLLSKEIQYIQNYLDLERLRQPAHVAIRFTTEGRVSDQMVAPLLFVPFVENSFKHGLNHSLTGEGYVNIRMRVQDNDLEFFIENNKTTLAIPREEHPVSGGIGLVNVRQRLELLYPGHYSLDTEETPTSYAVTLHLDMEDNTQNVNE